MSKKCLLFCVEEKVWLQNKMEDFECDVLLLACLNFPKFPAQGFNQSSICVPCGRISHQAKPMWLALAPKAKHRQSLGESGSEISF